MYVTYDRIVKTLKSGKYVYLILFAEGLLCVIGVVIASLFWDWTEERDTVLLAFVGAAMVWTLGTIMMLRYKVIIHDDYIVTEDYIEDVRLTYGGKKIRVSDGTRRNVPDYRYSFQSLQKYHKYGYIPLTISHRNIKPGHPYILVKEPNSNNIILTFPCGEWFIDYEDPKLTVVKPEDLKIFPHLPKGKKLDDSNSWPMDTTLKDSLGYLNNKLQKK